MITVPSMAGSHSIGGFVNYSIGCFVKLRKPAFLSEQGQSKSARWTVTAAFGFDQNTLFRVVSRDSAKNELGISVVKVGPGNFGKFVYTGRTVYAVEPCRIEPFPMEFYSWSPPPDDARPLGVEKNNDGNSTCAWCGGATKKVAFVTSFHDVCERCGK